MPRLAVATTPSVHASDIGVPHSLAKPTDIQFDSALGGLSPLPCSVTL